MPKRPNSCISYRVSCIYEAIRCLYSGGRVIGPRHFCVLAFSSSSLLSMTIVRPPPASNDEQPSFSATRRGRGGEKDWARSGEKRVFSPFECSSKDLRFFENPAEFNERWRSGSSDHLGPPFDFQPKLRGFGSSRAHSTGFAYEFSYRGALPAVAGSWGAHVTFPLSLLSQTRRYTVYAYINIRIYVRRVRWRGEKKRERVSNSR